MICIFCNEEILNNKHYILKKCKIHQSNKLIKSLDKIEKEINNKNIFNIIFLYWYSYEAHKVYLLMIDKSFLDFLYTRYINYLYYYNRWKSQDDELDKYDEEREETTDYTSNMMTISKNCYEFYKNITGFGINEEKSDIKKLLDNITSVESLFYYNNYIENKYEFLLAINNFINITRRFVNKMLIINKKYNNSKWNHKFERDYELCLDQRMSRIN